MNTDKLYNVVKTMSCLPSPSHHQKIGGVNSVNHSQSWVVFGIVWSPHYSIGWGWSFVIIYPCIFIHSNHYDVGKPIINLYTSTYQAGVVYSRTRFPTDYNVDHEVLTIGNS